VSWLLVLCGLEQVDIEVVEKKWPGSEILPFSVQVNSRTQVLGWLRPASPSASITFTKFSLDLLGLVPFNLQMPLRWKERRGTIAIFECAPADWLYSNAWGKVTQESHQKFEANGRAAGSCSQ